METRDKEIERLTRLLDGGRPIDAVVREGKRNSTDRVVAHLNVQVVILMLQVSHKTIGCLMLYFFVCMLEVKWQKSFPRKQEM